MATKSKTGSAKLSKKGRGFSAANLRALVAVLKKHKLEKHVLLDGTPLPDVIKAQFTTKSSAAVLDLMRVVFKFDGIHKPIRIFPNGQPPFIDRFDVDMNIHA
jgi:hypothetical protein